MFRVSKLCVPHTVPVSQIKRRMSLAKRLLNVSQTHSWESATRERMSVNQQSQFNAAGKKKKQQNSEQEQVQNTTSNHRWQKKIFSGIQPTGSMHLGNYLGAVRKWTELQNKRENITISIVDMHSITMPHNPPALRENIFLMAATLLACGIDPSHTTLFVQSSVLEHSELNWILNSLTTMPRLAQLPQFKEKSRTVRDVPLGLFVYPVLQAADIMLYKATHVPVGADQVQHIQLAQHLARGFNTRYGDMFPICNPLIEENEGSRILSLREPSKKMSKSDLSPKGTINLNDSPDQITEKIKKAVTDFTSDISYNPNARPGVSNLVNIHALVTGQSIESVVEEAKQLDTAQYKERVSEAVIEHLRPIRELINKHLSNRNELIYILEMGSEKARKVAQATMTEVKQRLGLGTVGVTPPGVVLAPQLQDHLKLTASQRLAKGVFQSDAHQHSIQHSEQGYGSLAGPGGDAGEAATGEAAENVSKQGPRKSRHTIVPIQTMRVEKSFNRSPSRHAFKLDNYNVPKIGFRDATASLNSSVAYRTDQRSRQGAFGFIAPKHLGVRNNISLKYGNSNPSALASVTSQVNAIYKQQESVSSLANSTFYKAASSSFNSINPSVVNMAAKTLNSRNNNSPTAAASPSLPIGNSSSSSANIPDITNNISKTTTSTTDENAEATAQSSSASAEEDGDSNAEDHEDEDEDTANAETLVEKIN